VWFINIKWVGDMFRVTGQVAGGNGSMQKKKKIGKGLMTNCSKFVRLVCTDSLTFMRIDEPF